MRSNKTHSDWNQIEKLLALASPLKAGLSTAQNKQAHMAKLLIGEVVR